VVSETLQTQLHLFVVVLFNTLLTVRSSLVVSYFLLWLRKGGFQGLVIRRTGIFHKADTFSQ
jgi:hypothetical protein